MRQLLGLAILTALCGMAPSTAAPVPFPRKKPDVLIKPEPMLYPRSFKEQLLDIHQEMEYLKANHQGKGLPRGYTELQDERWRLIFLKKGLLRRERRSR